MSASLERLFEELRPAAFAIAYRMLGSVSEAEDVVQEAFLRLHRMLREGERGGVAARLPCDGGHPAVHRPARSARARRERYVGEWLPEPLLASDEADPARHAEVADSLSLAFLVLLESLSPSSARRVLLREVFDYPYDQIARIVGKSEDNTRQLATWPAGRCRSVGRASKRRGSGARCWRGASSRRLSTASWRRWRSCWPTTCSTATAAARPRRSPTRCTAAPRSPGRRWRGRAGARIGGVSLQAAEVNGQPGALLLDPEGSWSLSSRSTSPTGRSRRSGRSSTPTSCGTSDPPPTSANSPAGD